MIIGSVYLGKKARKAYRKHQAEKVAKQITGQIDVVDPSDELKVKAPPASPTGVVDPPDELDVKALPASPVDRGLSPSSTYGDDCTGSELSSTPSNERRLAGPGPTSSPSSARSSHWVSSATTDRSPAFARFNARDPDRMLPQEPPSYDTVINSPPAVYSPMATHVPFDRAPSPFVQTYLAGPHTHDGCPACAAMMHHHQYHHSNFQPSSAVPGSWDVANAAELDPQRQPAAAELPAQPVHEQRPLNKDLQPMAEMADTSRAFEVPAELPAEIAKIKIVAPGDTGETRSHGTSSMPAELPSDTAGSEADETAATGSIDAPVNRSGEWKTAAHMPV